MNNRSAAGLAERALHERRSAIVARIRLREEWSELKGHDEPTQKDPKKIPEIIRKQQKPVRSASKVVSNKIRPVRNKASQKSPNTLQKKGNTNVLNNNDSATNCKDSALVMTSQKSKMDASLDVLRGVVALVDVGAENRALALRAALVALGASVVATWSPLVTHLIWTQDGCRSVRAKARALACRVVSPLWVEACASCGRRVAETAFPAATRPSDLPSPRSLRIMLKRAEAENIPLVDLFLEAGKENEKEKEEHPRLRLSTDTEQDTSTDRTTDTSRDRSRDTTDPEIRVNTLPRGAGARGPAPEHPKSRRKLFTQREAEDLTSGDESDTPAPKRTASKLTARQRKEMARAERMARKLLGAVTQHNTQLIAHGTEAPRIVLTGMSRTERQMVLTAIKSLNGRIQRQVDHRTTHVLLGSCQSSHNQFQPDTTGLQPLQTTSQLNRSARCEIPRARTLNALLGAARGCRILYAQWVMDSLEVKKWLHHHGYEVPHLRKISQKARVERAALGRTCTEYAYDVFNGMRVKISPQTDQRDAAIQLLTLCGGVVQNGDDIQDGGRETADFDVCIGDGDGQLSSKWVFDSVAAGRMRTTRRYVNLRPNVGNENR